MRSKVIWRKCTEKEIPDRINRNLHVKRKSGWMPTCYNETIKLTGDNKGKYYPYHKKPKADITEFVYNS